jgi:hypothetical protein
MTNKASIRRIPIWLRVSGIIALVLLAVLAGTMVLNAAGVVGGGGHGCGDQTVMTDHAGTDHSAPVGHDSGGGHGSAGGHGCGDATAVPR